MRYCSYCGKWFAGRPTYCPNCGRTWDYRICPRGHLNPPSALYCGECGSPDLSETSGRERWFSRIAGAIGKVLLKVMLIVIVFLMLMILSRTNLETLSGFVIAIGLLLIVFNLLPPSIKRPISLILRQIWKKTKSRGQSRR